MTGKFVLRNLRRRPFLNLVKIVGLSLALSCILLIVLFLKHELTFDRFHSKSDRIYRLTTTSQNFFNGKHFARMPNPSYVPDLVNYFPEVETFVRLAPIRGGVMKRLEEFFTFSQAFECDSTFFQVFDAELVVGNPAYVLDGPGSMVVSESFASKTFGESDPIGEILTLPPGQFYAGNADYTITGIMKDFPQSSHFHPDFITTPPDDSIFQAWAWTYLVLHANSNPENIISGFKDFLATYTSTDSDSIRTIAHLQPLIDIHLHSNKTREIEANSTMSVIYTFTLAALLLLIIALINYANLNIGMAGYSDKFLFMGKVYGSSNRMQLRYFLTEGIVIALVSLVVSAIIASIVFIFVQKQFNLNLYTGNTLFIASVSVLFSLLGIAAGILPLLRKFIRRFKTSLDFQNKIHDKRGGINKSLIVVQYTISIALITSVFVIHRQTKYALNNSLGAGDDNLICIEGVHSDVQQKFVEFKEEMVKYNSIKSVSAMFEPPGGDANDMFQFKLEGMVRDDVNELNNMIGVFPCDYSFASLFRLKFLGGKDFSERDEDHEGSGEYIINESAMRRLNYSKPEDIVGKEFSLLFGDGSIPIPSGSIIGVVRDFHLSSLKKKIEPLVLFKRKDLWLINFVISFQTGMQEAALKDIETVWQALFPEYTAHLEYVNSMYRNVYSTELLQAQLLTIFTIIALFICSMGLLGLSLLITQRRIKEIGIRKVNGAETIEIMTMLTWDFLKWILVSIMLAIPFAYFAMNRWLESFAYKTTLSWWIFAIAGLAGVIIALLTVSVKSWRASNKNPIEALRYE